MKRIDIMAKVLPEITGRSELEIRYAMIIYNFTHPLPGLFVDVPDDVARRLVKRLRDERRVMRRRIAEQMRRDQADPTAVDEILRNWNARH